MSREGAKGEGRGAKGEGAKFVALGTGALDASSIAGVGVSTTMAQVHIDFDHFTGDSISRIVVESGRGT